MPERLPDYTNEHITGAVSVPFYDPDPTSPICPRIHGSSAIARAPTPNLAGSPKV
jgi:hypothetical protein